jgi:hypothetical protein
MHESIDQSTLIELVTTWRLLSLNFTEVMLSVHLSVRLSFATHWQPVYMDIYMCSGQARPCDMVWLDGHGRWVLGSGAMDAESAFGANADLQEIRDKLEAKRSSLTVQRSHLLVCDPCECINV